MKKTSKKTGEPFAIEITNKKNTIHITIHKLPKSKKIRVDCRSE